MEASDVLLAGVTLLASFGGYVLAGVNEARRDRRASSADRERRAADARLRRDEDRHRAQLETLMSVQKDVQRLARDAGRTLAFDHMRAREGQYNQLPETWSEEGLAIRQSLSLHVARVLDPEVRAAVEEFSGTASKLSMLPTELMGRTGEDLEAAANLRMLRLVDAASAAQATVGVAVRRELEWEPAAD